MTTTLTLPTTLTGSWGGSGRSRLDLHPIEGLLSVQFSRGLLVGEAVNRVLFVCVENSNRSQMAEAFARMLGGHAVEAYSAGSNPSGVINPKAIAVMRELGYDLSAHWSKSLDDLPHVQFDFVATMGCGDKCPSISARKRADWALPDPRHMSLEEYRGVRDEIRERVRAMLSELDVSVPER
jgi:protein-tyrosine-phosphatase